MATEKMAKKSTNKKKSNLNSFSKFILAILLIAIAIIAVFVVMDNFNITTKSNDKKTNTEITSKKKVQDKTKTETKKQSTQSDTKSTASTSTKKDASNSKIESNATSYMEGCWISSEQGAFITLDRYGYRIDFSNVDASRPMTGYYSIDRNIITFTSDGNECKGIDGSYRITFYKKNISLICKDDKCTSRRNILETDWEWMDI